MSCYCLRICHCMTMFLSLHGGCPALAFRSPPITTQSAFTRIQHSSLDSYIRHPIVWLSTVSLNNPRKRLLQLYNKQSEGRDSSVDIATGYGLDDQGIGVRVPVGAIIFTSPCRSERLWGPPSLLSNGYWRLFPRR
jgi:hypothetical protein